MTMKRQFVQFFATIIIFAFCLNYSASFAQDNNGHRHYDRAKGETPSHLPVPRFVSLRNNVVNARSGPDKAYPIRFVYRQRGLPVKVVAETDEWRRIEDPDGTRVWVHRLNLDVRRTAMIRSSSNSSVSLHEAPNPNSKIEARLNNGVICEIIDTRPNWRKVRIGRYIGWVVASELWGA